MNTTNDVTVTTPEQITTALTAAGHGNWVVDPDFLTWTVSDAGSGVALAFEPIHYGGKAGRIEILAYPADRALMLHRSDVPVGSDRMTVDGRRDASAIARDIARRLLGPARESVERAQKNKEVRDSAEAARLAVSTDLAAIPGVEVSRWSSGHLTITLNDGEGSARITTGAAVDVELHNIPPARARAIFEFLTAQEG